MPHCVAGSVNIVNEDMSFQSGHATQAFITMKCYEINVQYQS